MTGTEICTLRICPPVNWISTLHPADLNRNGRIDLAGCYRTSYDTLRAWVFGTTTLRKLQPWLFAFNSWRLSRRRRSDFNGDGKLDLAVGWTVTPVDSAEYNGISVFFGTSAGGFSAPVEP